jgi:hypothetical protein
MTRIWKTQERGAIGTVKMYIRKDELPARIVLPSVLVSDDATFDGSDTNIPMTEVSIGGIDYYTADVDFDNGDFFTFGGVVSGPGGVSSALSLWVKADAGTSTTTNNTTNTKWTNQADGIENTTQSTTTPTFITDGANFNPTIRFNSQWYRWNGTNFGLSGSNSFDVITAHTRTLNSTNDGAILGGSGNGAFQYLHRNGATGKQQLCRLVLACMTASLTNINIGHPSIGGVSRSGNDFLFQFDGQSDGGFSDANAFSNTTEMNVGSVSVNNGNFYEGDMHEVVTFTRTLTTTERQQVNSYLAIKYGITLTPGVATDYLASDETVVWSGDADYQYNILGIGLDIPSTLHQQIAASETPGDILTLSTDDNFTDANGTHAIIADNMSYLIIGSNDGSTAVSTTNVLGTTTLKKINKTWRIQNTNMDQCVNYQFELAAPTGDTKWYVVIADDDAFTTNVEYSELTVSGGLATTAIHFPSNSTSFMTLALLDATSLVDLGGNVGISTTGHDFTSDIASNSYLDIRAHNLGLVLPRVNGTAGITQAQGMMIYDTSDNTFKVSNGTEWRPLGEPATRFCD